MWQLHSVLENGLSSFPPSFLPTHMHACLVPWILTSFSKVRWKNNDGANNGVLIMTFIAYARDMAASKADRGSLKQLFIWKNIIFKCKF